MACIPHKQPSPGIISNMSEAEIQELLDSISEAGIIKLLKGLEKWKKAKLVDKRKH